MVENARICGDVEAILRKVRQKANVAGEKGYTRCSQLPWSRLRLKMKVEKPAAFFLPGTEPADG